MKAFFKDLKENASSFIKNSRGAAIFLIAVYLIALFPLFRANFNYRDDGGRVLWAYDDWNNFGRVTSNTLSHIVHADKYLRDISPLTQIIAVLLIVAASLLLLKAVRGSKKLTVWDALCVLPLGLFPYFLCCFSYKYDAPYMALSVLVSVIPLVFRKRGWVYYLIAFVCSLLMCTTYQASAGIFPMLVIFTAFIDWKSGEKTGKVLRFCLFSALAFIAALLIFFLLIPKGDGEYVTTKMAMDLSSVKHIISNYWTYIYTFKRDFRIHWFVVIALISAMFMLWNILETDRNRILTLLVGGVVYVLLFVFSFGPYPFLSEPFLMPRGMYGLGVFITFICLGATQFHNAENKLKAIKATSLISVIALSWLCIVFTCTYGNALSAQKKYDEFRIEEVAVKLADLDLLNDEERTPIQVTGSIGYASGIRNISGDRLLLRLVPPPFGGDNYWSYLKLLSYYGLPEMEYTKELINDSDAGWQIVDENCYHTIYSDGERVIIELKGGDPGQ